MLEKREILFDADGFPLVADADLARFRRRRS